MQIFQSASFAKGIKKLPANQRAYVDNAVHTILSNPLIGEAKIGDLAGVRVYKFRMVNQLTLLAYIYNEQDSCITLLTLGSQS